MDNELYTILGAYRLKPDKVDAITNRLYKITAGNQRFALKKSRLHSSEIGKWQAIYQTLNQYNIHGFIPLYYSEDKTPYYVKDQTVYYLMPWYEWGNRNHPVDDYLMVAHALGKLHATTMVTHSIESYIDHLPFTSDQYLQGIRETQQKMLEYVRYFESKRFMAPHELQICMYYKDIENTVFHLLHWYEMYLDQKKATKQVKNTLCHGNINSSHYIIHNEMVYFLNWESSSRDIPTADLTKYYHHLFHYQDCDIEKIKESYNVYCQYIDLSDYEKITLALQLLSLEKWMSLVEECIKNPSNAGSIQLSIKIEKEYRKLLYSIQFQNTIHESLKINRSNKEQIFEEF